MIFIKKEQKKVAILIIKIQMIYARGHNYKLKKPPEVYQYQASRDCASEIQNKGNLIHPFKPRDGETNGITSCKLVDLASGEDLLVTVLSPIAFVLLVKLPVRKEKQESQFTNQKHFKNDLGKKI